MLLRIRPFPTSFHFSQRNLSLWRGVFLSVVVFLLHLFFLSAPRVVRFGGTIFHDPHNSCFLSPSQGREWHLWWEENPLLLSCWEEIKFKFDCLPCLVGSDHERKRKQVYFRAFLLPWAPRRRKRICFHFESLRVTDGVFYRLFSVAHDAVLRRAYVGT